MNTKSIFYAIVSLAFITFSSFSQERIPGDKINPKAIVSIEQSGVSFIYRYILSNGQIGKQSIWQYELYLAPNISIESMNDPVNWRGSYLNENGELMIHWGTRTDADIQPGQSLGGYSISAVSLPGIVPFYAEGWVPSPDSIAEDDVQDSIYHNLTPYGPGVVGKTVGPTAPPINLIATEWIDTLNSYVNQSLTLGWLISHNDGVADALIRDLKSARRNIEKGNSINTRADIVKFLSKVEDTYASSQHAQTKGNKASIVMTNECYSILKYNGEYLRDRLPTRK